MSPDSTPQVLVAVVSWNSAAHLEEAIRSVPPGVPVVVVDNASSDGSASLARRAGARVLEPGRNLGFGPACNLAAKEGGPSGTILFLNPDAALLDGAECLGTLLAELDRDPSLGAVAPALVGTGQERFQLRRFPTACSIAREAFLLNRLLPENRGFLRERYLDRPRDVPFDVEQPAGAAFLVRREAFEAIGGFDPMFVPAWFEDVDLCARLWKSGRKIRYVPAARAAHVGGAAMNALPYRDFLPLYTRNLFRYLSRHASFGSRASARLVSGAGAILRLVLLPFVSGDHGRKDAAAAYVRVAAGLLGLGWRSALRDASR